MRPDFTVVGAGMAGTLMACYLARGGHTVDVYERGPDPRQAGTREPGHSFNMVLSARGMHALGRIGLDEAVERMAMPLRGRMVHELGLGPEFHAYGGPSGEHQLRSVSRHGLNELLVEMAAATPGVHLHFRRRCVSVDFQERRAAMLDEDTQQLEEVDFVTIVGADGVESTVRRQMRHVLPTDFHLDNLAWGYKELTIPPAARGGWRLDPECIHMWPRHEFFLVAYPNLNGSFTCTLYMPYQGPHGFEALKTPSDVWRFFEESFPDAMGHMPSLLEDFAGHPVLPIQSMDCQNWHLDERAVLIGDAAHAVVPFYGQGMNSAFEDCELLEEVLRRHGSDRAGAFSVFQATRKPDTDALAHLSMHNFEELRSGLISSGGRLREQVLSTLHHWFPDIQPLFRLVSFTRVPYAKALEQSRRQDRWLTAAAAGGVLGTLLATSWLMARRPGKKTGEAPAEAIESAEPLDAAEAVEVSVD